jgi:hypothetical protein
MLLMYSSSNHKTLKRKNIGEELQDPLFLEFSNRFNLFTDEVHFSYCRCSPCGVPVNSGALFCEVQFRCRHTGWTRWRVATCPSWWRNMRSKLARETNTGVHPVLSWESTATVFHAQVSLLLTRLSLCWLLLCKMLLLHVILFLVVLACVPYIAKQFTSKLWAVRLGQKYGVHIPFKLR